MTPSQRGLLAVLAWWAFLAAILFVPTREFTLLVGAILVGLVSYMAYHVGKGL